ncbi:hypothetical protein BOO86_21765 [Mycobacterium sp. CBMA 234]|nr:hypothetical protein [Mycolicibacterium sp. CBMA 234]
MAMLIAPLWLGGAAPAAADDGHAVRYLMRADGGVEAEIHYRVDPPSTTGNGANYEHVWISPGEPFERSTVMEEPRRYAYISVRNMTWNPNFQCELWIDDKLVQKAKGYCGLSEVDTH